MKVSTIACSLRGYDFIEGFETLRPNTFLQLLAIIPVVSIGSPVQAQTMNIPKECDVRLQTEFREVLSEASKTLNFIPLRTTFGSGQSELVGLPCSNEELRAILESAGYSVSLIRPAEDGGETGVVGFLYDRSWLRFILGNRRVAQAEIRLKNGATFYFSIGPTK